MGSPEYDSSLYGSEVSGDDVTCTNCNHKFNWVLTPEVKMGYVKCPSCGQLVDQNGTAWAEWETSGQFSL